MEPVDRACNTAKRVPDEIATLHVCKLVQKNCATAIGAPCVAVSRKHDCRLKKSARKRHLRFIAAKKSRRLLELETIGYFIQRCAPVTRIEWMCAPHDAANHERAVCEPSSKTKCDRCPQHQR